jgi:quercetin dioxygenase-like cupin family protein
MTDITTITDPLSTAFALAAARVTRSGGSPSCSRSSAQEAALGLVDCTLERGSEPPMHIHTRESEFIYVIDGELTAYVGDETLSVQTGGFVFMPRNVPHTFAVDGTGEARAFLMYAPNGFERVFSDRRTADYVPGVPGTQAARHDLTIVGQAFEDAGLIITGPHPRDL